MAKELRDGWSDHDLPVDGRAPDSVIRALVAAGLDYDRAVSAMPRCVVSERVKELQGQLDAALERARPAVVSVLGGKKGAEEEESETACA
ncbi:MAG: hypothetical protein F9K16_12725 [Thermoanaerobaculia bacterium]|nr:MAG: hypothetical protein F9K16_12725 [Thermoanaerobaculia bacterium]MBZ0101629.1 hypothetical protein [Thermoanaerobaculia bacterium]